jgi:hypothetical protein
MWRSFLAAGALRLGLVVWLGIEVHQQGGFLSLLAIYLNPFEILLAAGAVLLLSVVNTGVTAAFGILASLFTQRSGRALVLAAVMRTFVLLFLAGGLWITGDHIRHIESDDPSVWIMSASVTSLLENTSRTMADNGSLLAASLAGSTAPRPMGEIQYVLYILIPLALYLLLIWALLWIAQRVAVRQGAYQPTRYERFRPRKKKRVTV